MLSGYEKREKFEQIQSLIAELQREELAFNSQPFVEIRLSDAQRCLQEAERAILIRDGVIQV